MRSKSAAGRAAVVAGWIGVGASIGLFPVGCRTAPGALVQYGPAAPSEVIEPADVALMFSNSTTAASSVGIDVLDVRPASEFEAGHVEGAVHVDPKQWADLSLAADTGLADEAGWRDRIGALGVGDGDTVLIYDGGQMTNAARVWFILQHLGVPNTRVVNGGFPAIQREVPEIGLVAGPGRAPGAVQVQVVPASARVALVERQQLRQRVDAGDVQVWDARRVDEYRGVDLMNNKRGGHLPNAVNLPHAELLSADGKLKPASELATILEAAGFERGAPIVTHCQGGGRAALAALAAQEAGFGPVSNYYLSFGDWAADETCPLVTPE